MVDELLSIFARFEDYDGIHHFATQALNLVPENVKAQYWLVYSIYHSGVVALAKREIEKAKCRLTSDEFNTLQKFICKDESLPYGQLFDWKLNNQCRRGYESLKGFVPSVFLSKNDHLTLVRHPMRLSCDTSLSHLTLVRRKRGSFDFRATLIRLSSDTRKLAFRGKSSKD